MIYWDKACRPKCEDDLGIRKVQDVNSTLLTKLEWEVLSDNLWVKVESAKYLTKDDFLKVKKSVNASMMRK